VGRVLGVSRSGVDAREKRPPSARQRQHERLLERIGEIHVQNRGGYGSPRIHAELVVADGERIGRKRVERRRIVGRSMADHTRTALVTDAPQMALARRRPEPGLIGHSDQGSPFVSPASGRQARAAGIAQSMGSRGDRFDNAVAESLLATPNKELIHGRSRPTKAELRTEVLEHIEIFSNRHRRHATLGMPSPVQIETASKNNKERIEPATVAAEKPVSTEPGELQGAALGMVFELLKTAEERWRRFNGQGSSPTSWPAPRSSTGFRVPAEHPTTTEEEVAA
jgi:hypothetical protein